MPGLIGYKLNKAEKRTDELIGEMASALEPEERFRVETYSEAELGLGRVSLGVINPEPQPVWNESGDVCLVMEGEIYNHQEILTELGVESSHSKLQDQAELILYLYLKHAENFAANLNGAFSIAIWDERQDRLLLANDRLGLQPLYYAKRGNGLLFSSGVRALLADRSVSRQIDPIAIAEFLTFDHILHNRTFLDGVKLLEPASVLTYQHDQLRIRPYWQLKYAETHPLVSVDECIEELSFLLRQSIARHAYDDLPSGLLLSGGLDSRWLAALLMGTSHGKNLRMYTFGIPGCNDERFARQVAKVLDCPHEFYELRSDWLMEQAENAVRSTDGMGNIVNLHALAALKEQSEYAKIIYKGFLGDAMFGYSTVPRFWADYDDKTRFQAHWKTHQDQGVIYTEPGQYKDLFSDAFNGGLEKAVIEEYRKGMQGTTSRQLANQRLFFDLRQRVPRMTIKGVEVVRQRAAVRLPFCDNDLVEFSTRLPPGYQHGRFLITEAFIRTCPELAKIPRTPSNLPMVNCVQNVYIQGMQLAKWHLQKLGFGGIVGSQYGGYQNYNEWFRTALKLWVEKILLNSRSLDRGYFKPEYIQNMIIEHMAGENHSVRLGALISIELWHQMFVD